MPLIWMAKSCQYHAMKNIRRVSTTLSIPNLSSSRLLQTSAVTGTYSVFRELKWMW